MKHIIRIIFSRYWYSFCSAHRKYRRASIHCKQCQHGSWRGEIKQYRSRKWYREHEVVNGQFQPKKKP